jgi:hypothetical protein
MTIWMTAAMKWTTNLLNNRKILTYYKLTNMNKVRVIELLEKKVTMKKKMKKLLIVWPVIKAK